MASQVIVIVAVLCVSLQMAESIRYSEVFPHGEDAGDTILDRGDYVNVTANLQSSLPIFGTDRDQIRIFTDGYAELRASNSDTAVRFSIFEADADTGAAGYVSWRQVDGDSMEASVISSVTDSVFPDLAPVTITSAVLIFWVGVGYYGSDGSDDIQVNSFELALATDGTNTFAIYVYVNDRITWTTGARDGGTNGLGGNHATVGITRDNDMMFRVEGSNTDNVLLVDNASNTGLRGLWYFKVDGNMVETPDAQECVLGCDDNAECTSMTIGYSCVCNENYIGEDATEGSCELEGGAAAVKAMFAVILLAISMVFFL